MMKKEKDKQYEIEWGRLLRRLSPYNIKKGFLYMKHYGAKGFWEKLTERFQPEEVPYGPWFEEHRAKPEQLEEQKKKRWEREPLISIVVPVYRTPENYLREMIQSVLDQSYGNWELCIADGSGADAALQAVIEQYSGKDKRIKYKLLEENLGIADNSNAALAMASGDYIGFLDHDDLLEPDAVFEVVKMLNEQPDTDIVYTDEDKVAEDLSEYFQPHFKPDFNLDLLCSNNYICHFFVVSAEILKKVKGFQREFEGAQDYDFIFRCVEATKKIRHIPKILYHWRVHKESTAENPASKRYAFEAGKRVIRQHIIRQGLHGAVDETRDHGFYQVRYAMNGLPKVSIIIPNKDEYKTLKKCIDSIKEKTTYSNYEIIIVENNSTTKEIKEYYKQLEEEGTAKIIVWEGEFNYSAINNFGVQASQGEFLLFLNNDVEIISKYFFEDMISNCQRKEVGIVGCKLLYPDDTVQHAGVIIGIGGVAGHVFAGMPANQTGYMHKASLQQNLSAVTAACMMVKRSVFEEAGGFEEKLAVAFNDIDFCLKVRKLNYLVVYNPSVLLYHFESKSRGAEDTEEKIRRFQNEIEYMRTKWEEILKNGDPYYNKNLSLTKWNYSLGNRQ